MSEYLCTCGIRVQSGYRHQHRCPQKVTWPAEHEQRLANVERRLGSCEDALRKKHDDKKVLRATCADCGEIFDSSHMGTCFADRQRLWIYTGKDWVPGVAVVESWVNGERRIREATVDDSGKWEVGPWQSPSVYSEDTTRLAKDFKKRATEAGEKAHKHNPGESRWINGYWAGRRDAFEDAEATLRTELGIREQHADRG